MPDSAFLPAADTRIAHSGQTAAFIPGPDAQSTFCLRYETYLLYSAVVRFKLTVIDKSGFGHTAFKPALQSPGVGFGQVVAGIHGNNRTPVSYTHLGGDFPARSCVQVAKLPLGGLVEVECIAQL